MSIAPYSEPTTSKVAAENLNQEKRFSDCVRIYEFLKKRGKEGATDLEIQESLDIHGDTERPRRGELEKSGRIVKADRKRKTRSGRFAAVWIAVE
jgi:hypothetical protein